MTLFNILTIFATILFLLLALHDLVAVPPLTNLADLKKHESDARRYVDSIINGLCGIVPLGLLIYFNPAFAPLELWRAGPALPPWAHRTILWFYGLLLLGAFLSWWVPYIFGSPKSHRDAFEKFKNTHHFLPARGENVVPNTFHVLLHALMLMCFLLALKL